MTITQTSPSTSSEFVSRHIGPRESDIQTMLETLGYSSLDELVDTAVPADIRQGEPLHLPAALSETEVLATLRGIASKNVLKTQMIGQGFYDTITPPVIRRNIVENPAWYTAYTPYQPEISQGRLEALLNFQTMVMDLTGLPIANASLLDESSAAAEAVLMMRRANKKKANGKTVLDSNLFPQTIKVVQGRAEALASRSRSPIWRRAARGRDFRDRAAAAGQRRRDRGPPADHRRRQGRRGDGHRRGRPAGADHDHPSGGAGR